jgi:hypothetical protein
MPVDAAQEATYFWGDGMIMKGVHLERLRMGTALAMAVRPDLVESVGEGLRREGWAVERRGGALCVRGK